MPVSAGALAFVQFQSGLGQFRLILMPAKDGLAQVLGLKLLAHVKHFLVHVISLRIFNKEVAKIALLMLIT